ncbi:MAG: extracellular solute-binding protein, partial [Clostridia bacterium]|nr:extracellular solute-binding protein [Clostridia bacterium]
MRIPAWIFTLLFLCTVLLSCESTVRSDPDNKVPAAEADILTHIYHGKTVALPEGYRQSNVTPLYEDGIFTVFCTADTDSGRQYRLVSFDESGTVTDDSLFSACESFLEGALPRDGLITQDEVILYASREKEDGKYAGYLARISRTDGTLTRSEDIYPFFSSTESGERWHKKLGFTMDKSGTIYFFSEDEMLVLDGNFSCLLCVPSLAWIEGFSRTPDGDVTVYGTFSNGRKLYRIHPETHLPEVLADVPDDIAPAEHFYDCAGTLFFSADDGIYALRDGTPVLIMHFQNSSLQPNRFSPDYIVGEELILASVANAFHSGTTLQIFEKSPDLLLDNLEVIDIAAVGEIDWMTDAMLSEYSRLHRAIRVEVSDYRGDEGEQRLLTEIQTGKYRPDCIIGPPETAVLRKIVDDELYCDILPYLEADENLSPDDFFGAVLEIFDDDGKMWGITPKFTVASMFAPKSKLEDGALSTLGELLDYAENLPNGEVLMNRLTKSQAEEMLLGPMGYAVFLRPFSEKTFDMETFVRWLDFLSELPQNIEDYDELLPGKHPADQYTGKVSLDGTHYSPQTQGDFWLRWCSRFGTEEITVLGYPGTGSYASCAMAFVITAFADKPDLVWELLR